MDDHAIADQRALYGCRGSDKAVAADLRRCADDRIGGNDRPRAYRHVRPYDGTGFDDDPGLEAGLLRNDRARRNAALAGHRLRPCCRWINQTPDQRESPLRFRRHQRRGCRRNERGKVIRAQHGRLGQSIQQRGIAPALDEDQQILAALRHRSDSRDNDVSMARVDEPGPRQLGDLGNGNPP